MIGKVLVMALALVVLVAAEEKKAEGRQMNWSNLNFATKPGYSQSYPSSSFGSDDLSGSSSMLNAQAKSSGNFQGMVPQSLDGQDISRGDGGYSGSSNYGSNSDYGYEAASDTSYGSAVGYGYDYQGNLPKPSGPFYSNNNNNPSFVPNPIPNSFLRGVPREQHDYSASSLSSMQSGKLPYYLQKNFNATSGNKMVNRAGYDEDAPLGGGISSPLTGSMLSGTTARNTLSRQDDFSYGTVNGGYGTIPPAATGYGYGAGYGTGGYGAGYGTGGYGGSYGYGSPYASGYSSYGGYRSPLYAGYGSGGYGYGNGYGGGYGSGYGGSYGSGYGNSYGAGYGYGNGYGGSYGAGYGSGYGGGYGNSYGAGYGYGNGYGGGYGYGSGYGGEYLAVPAHYKKTKKAFGHWFGGVPYGGAGYGYGSNYAAIPYDYYYDPPGVWHLTKFAMKSMMKSMFRPFFKWLPFCSPFFYRRSDRSDDKQSNFVSALTAFLPIGLFLAAIVPNVVTISGRRKRSETEEAKAAQEEATFPILDMISSFGVRSLQEPSCQSKIVCEIGRMGGLPDANIVQRALWLTANYVPESVSNLIGADKIFRHIRSQQCSEFMCSSD